MENNSGIYKFWVQKNWLFTPVFLLPINITTFVDDPSTKSNDSN